MGDLQCAATVLVVRHREAGHDRPDVLSDDGGWLTPTGIAQVGELAARLAGRNVALVYSSPLARAEPTAQRLATALGVAWRTLPGVEELPVAEVSRAVLDGVVARCTAALEGVADQHRGETVVVVSHGGVMSIVLPRLAFDAPDDLAQGRPLPDVGVVELMADDDGWSLRSWPG